MFSSFVYETLERGMAPRGKQPTVLEVVGGQARHERVQRRVDGEELVGVIQLRHFDASAREVEHDGPGELVGDLDRVAEDEAV